MRSWWLFGTVAISLGLILMKALEPQQAGAAIESLAPLPAPGSIVMSYTDYETERRLVGDVAWSLPPREEREWQPLELEEPESAAVDAVPGDPVEEMEAEEAPAGEDTAPEEYAAPQAPVADAGADRLVWVGRGDIALDGSASRGEGLTYTWRQVSGEPQLTIAKPDAAVTTASGLGIDPDRTWQDAEYEFELTVMDGMGETDTDTVVCSVKTAPPLRISPLPKKELTVRDKIVLAQFSATRTNRTGTVESFEIRYRGELFIHQIGGEADYEMTVTQSGAIYCYQISVYYEEGRATSSLEFFVDTPERVPAIVQFQVNWE